MPTRISPDTDGIQPQARSCPGGLIPAVSRSQRCCPATAAVPTASGVLPRLPAIFSRHVLFTASSLQWSTTAPLS